MARTPDKTFKVKEVAEAVQASPGYLVKVMQELTKAGILSARRGSQGGFTLIRKAEELTALDVINAIDPIERIHTCPLSLSSHGKRLCPLHRRIDESLRMIEESFRSATIAALLNQTGEPIPVCDMLCEEPTELKS